MATFKYKYDDLFNPTIEAIHALGGSASVSEIEDGVAKILKLSEEEINEIHRGNITKLSYRLAWARNYLKRYGLLENSARGVWSLTANGLKVKSVDKREVTRQVKRITVTEGEVADKGEGEEADDSGEPKELEDEGGSEDKEGSEGKGKGEFKFDSGEADIEDRLSKF